jgi:hypothetical protein
MSTSPAREPDDHVPLLVVRLSSRASWDRLRDMAAEAQVDPSSLITSIIEAVMADDALMAPPVWTEPQVRTLRILRALRATPRQIAATVGHAPEAVREKIRELGI